MATRVTPVAQVELLDPGQQHQVKYDGFGRTDLVADMLSGGYASPNFVDWRGATASGSAARYPAAMTVAEGDLNCVIARPFLDVSQGMGLGHFTPQNGTWAALKNLGLPNEVKLYQSDGKPNQASSIISNFELPANPVFCCSLYRAEPDPEHDWTSYPPHTEIHFGIGDQSTWAIVMPYAGSLFLMYYGENGWQRVSESERSVHVPSLEGLASGQRLFLWVAALRGRIVISTDGFVEDVWVHEVPGHTLQVPQGKISLHHNAGQWMFSHFAINMPTAEIDSAPIACGYDTLAATGETFLSIRHAPVVDDNLNPLAAVVAADSTQERTDLNTTQRAWKATIAPYQHEQIGVGVDPDSGQPVDFHTHVSPQLYGVQIGQYAEITNNGAAQITDITPDVIEIHGEHPQDTRAAAYDLELDNQLGQFTDIEEYRRVKVSLGWLMSDESVDVAQTVAAYVVEPSPAILPDGKARLDLSLLDPIVRLRDEKSDGRCPVFDGWEVKSVFQWVLDRCGLDRAEQLLEDTGTRLSLGQPERPLWYPEAGRPWFDFLAEVAKFDYSGGIYFDETGSFVKACRFCRQQRTAANVIQHDGSGSGACPTSVDWELYTRGSVATEPTDPGEILKLARSRQTLSSLDFANYVAVCGVGPDGRPIQAVTYAPGSLYDPANDQYVGWRKMHVESLESYVSQDLVNRLCQERFADLSRRPEHVSIVTPLMAEMRVGQVVLIQGGETIGVSGEKYRITSVNHAVRKRQPSTATTAITARWLD